VKSILLVTGSRSLAASPAAEAWARSILRERIAVVPDRGWLFVGDANGPDRWAVEIAAACEVNRAMYKLDGMVAVDSILRGGAFKFWAPAEVARARRGDRTWPLERNKALVESAQKAACEGWVVSCLALVDPASRTRGTMHAVTQARKAGLPVEVLEWRG
jgi:hypothetical protein